MSDSDIHSDAFHGASIRYDGESDADREARRRNAERIEAKAESLGDSLPRLLIDAERVAATVAQGIHGRRRVGMGETFWQYRSFESHDAATAIDWRRSARTDELFVRETEWEAAQTVWLWADSSPSMAYRSNRNLTEKGDRAAMLLLATAALLLRGGERVALIGREKTAGMGRSMLNRLANHLLLDPGAETGLPPAQRLPRHAQAVLFGDFLGPLDELEKRISTFSEQGVGGYCVQILDPAEESLPFTGRTRFLGMEEEGELISDKAETLRGGYRQRLLAHRQRFGELARAAGWEVLLHHTDRPAEEAVMSLYLALSQTESGGAGTMNMRGGY